MMNAKDRLAAEKSPPVVRRPVQATRQHISAETIRAARRVSTEAERGA